MIDIRYYRGDDCPDEVYSFRYDVYVSELKRQQHYACHKTKTIRDPLDPTAYHGVAYRKNKVVAAVRLNFVRDGNLGEYRDLYGIDSLSESEQRASAICTRIMTDKKYRHTPLGFRVIESAFRFSAEHDVTICLIDVNNPRRELFEKLGFKALHYIHHPEYGEVCLMRLDGLDLDHLQKVGSPFCEYSEQYTRIRAARQLSSNRLEVAAAE